MIRDESLFPALPPLLKSITLPAYPALTVQMPGLFGRQALSINQFKDGFTVFLRRFTPATGSLREEKAATISCQYF
jgi:hypothetical protein